MKLAELSTRSGVNIATIKYWIRAGILPAGVKRNATTADYTDRHLARLNLIHLLRDDLDTPIDEIRELTHLIDTHAPNTRIMEKSQCLALRLTHPPQNQDSPEHQRVRAICEQLGWPDVPSWAREELVVVLRRLGEKGLNVDNDYLLEHARAFAKVASHNVGYALTAREPDELAIQVIRGVRLSRDLENAISALAHTSHSLSR